QIMTAAQLTRLQRAHAKWAADGELRLGWSRVAEGCAARAGEEYRTARRNRFESGQAHFGLRKTFTCAWAIEKITRIGHKARACSGTAGAVVAIEFIARPRQAVAAFISRQQRITDAQCSFKMADFQPHARFSMLKSVAHIQPDAGAPRAIFG